MSSCHTDYLISLAVTAGTSRCAVGIARWRIVLVVWGIAVSCHVMSCLVVVNRWQKSCAVLFVVSHP